MGRPTKENSLSRQDVVAAAIACIDREGASALSVSRVARELGIKPPAIYKHLESGLALQKSVVCKLWGYYLQECQEKIIETSIPSESLKQMGHFARHFARTYPARAQIMMQTRLQTSDPEAAEIIQQFIMFLRQMLGACDLADDRLIDVMRMINAAIYGFITIEQAGLMTLERSADRSFEVMLEALMVAIAHIQQH
ncbi:TetR/AcrR family transcriptional regulator [Pseudanabaena sp. UWO311]|uniref:TetR/AcrR family transcriptional regulator n=1 Tax=Pseudanabaena sp. UWO311 TaxID=2487337 RepID=UPI00115C05D2|nr:TetR/AcrR family transcriptional regulator [Pseudanabaena sp. UWO311]TYQ25108.1 TetR/AcrR family transcriptional regulator [Pseudanabaena sp. UWO311]